MSLNSVVNKLVRAAASVPTDISESELDSHVAKLLAEEARANDSKWSELGLGAFVGSSGPASRNSPDPSLPKPNKRFLSSVIRAVDGHNSALLKQQAESARSARDRQIRKNPRHDDGKRGANRLFGSALGGVGRPLKQDGARDRGAKERPRETRREEHDRRDPGRHESDQHRSRDDCERRRHDPDSEDDRRRRRRDRSGERRRDRETRSPRRRRHDSDDDKDHHRERDRDRHRSRRDRSRSRSRSRDRRDGEKKRRERRNHSRSPSPRRSSRRADPSQPRPPSVSPPPAPPSPGRESLSRMDKYFQPDYDPRLDFTGVQVPKSGPVMDFGWDSMLSVLKDRGKKRRRNSPGLSASPEPVRRPIEKPSSSRVVDTVGPSEPEKSVMDMEYTKRGQMRAWDVGK